MAAGAAAARKSHSSADGAAEGVGTKGLPPASSSFVQLRERSRGKVRRLSNPCSTMTKVLERAATPKRRTNGVKRHSAEV